MGNEGGGAGRGRVAAMGGMPGDTVINRNTLSRAGTVKVSSVSDKEVSGTFKIDMAAGEVITPATSLLKSLGIKVPVDRVRVDFDRTSKLPRTRGHVSTTWSFRLRSDWSLGSASTAKAVKFSITPARSVPRVEL